MAFERPAWFWTKLEFEIPVLELEVIPKGVHKSCPFVLSSSFCSAGKKCPVPVYAESYFLQFRSWRQYYKRNLVFKF